MAHDVFISYSSADRNVGLAACAHLEGKGFKCWIAPRDIMPGQDWGEAIIDGISGARLFVLIFSGNANTSHQVRREVERAVNRGLPVIPFRIEDVPPSKSLEYFMSAPHWLDALTPPLERHLDYLAEVAGHLLAGQPRPVPPPAPPAPVHHRPPQRWPWIAGAAGLAAVVLVALFLWLRSPEDEMLASAPAPAPAAAPGDPLNLVDLRAAPTDSAPGNWVAAPPLLANAAIRTRITGIQPVGWRPVIINSVNLYEGRIVWPTHGQNMLTLLAQAPPAGEEPWQGNTAFTLEFDRPLTQFGFMVPGLYGDSENGASFPAFSAEAFDEAGQPVDRVSRVLRRSGRDAVPPESFTLTAPPERRIRSVRFESDYRLRGRPFAAFQTLLIERLTYRADDPD